MHGHRSANLSIRQCRIALLHHLLTGACCKHTQDTHKKLAHQDRTACICISEGFDSADALSSSAFDLVLSSNAKILDTVTSSIGCYILGV